MVPEVTLIDQMEQPLRQYLEEEYDAKRLLYVVVDPAPYIARRQELRDRYYSAPGFDLPIDLSARTVPIAEGKETEWRQETFSRMAPRTLFQMKQYRHRTQGEYVRAYVSSVFASEAHEYSEIWLIKAVPDRPFAFLAAYTECPTCHSLGKDRYGDKCRECGGRGWKFHGKGTKLTSWGKLVGVRKFVRPTVPQEAEEYDRE